MGARANLFPIKNPTTPTLFAINCSETRCRKSEACLKCSLTEPKPYECKRNIETVLDKASGKDFFKGDD
ncbi:hypothetical protein QTP88_008373 [Uroleucon formosanum]